MPATSKWACMLEEVADHHVQQKWACTLHMVYQLLDDLPSSDGPANTNMSELSLLLSSLSSVSSLLSSGASDHSGSPSLGTHSRHSSKSSSSEFSSFEDFDHLKDTLLKQWDAQIQSLAIYLLTVRVLEASPPVKKSSQLDLYLTHFRYDHPDRFQKKLCVLPLVFDHLVELIDNDHIFHNNSNIPQHPTHIQLTIFLVRVGHYSNISAPEYVA
jgi:hypothetical protein